MQMPQGLAAQHSRELFPEDVSGEQFPSGEKGGRLLCSAFAFPRLNCSRREVLKSGNAAIRFWTARTRGDECARKRGVEDQGAVGTKEAAV